MLMQAIYVVIINNLIKTSGFTELMCIIKKIAWCLVARQCVEIVRNQEVLLCALYLNINKLFSGPKNNKWTKKKLLIHLVPQETWDVAPVNLL